jgi:2-keto-4-pentenoate hydratase/2-oxohepta-3-ene-1,7-dioic acid hydratase in catechol pathway
MNGLAGSQLVSFQLDGGAMQPGVARADEVISFEALGVQHGSVRDLIRAGGVEDVIARASDAFAAGDSRIVPHLSVRLGPPIPNPEKIICLGLNYADHAAEARLAAPGAPTVFAKFPNCLVGPTDPIVIPGASDQIDYEGELAVIVGRPCKEVGEEDALDYVAGYSAFNDVTARDLQMQTSQWTLGKAVDTFGPLGPGIVPRSAIPDPQKLKFTTRVNGRAVQHGDTAHMIFTIAQTIAFVSRTMTLSPGDIIATGTPSGVGFVRKPPVFLTAGDVVEVEIEGIGVLRNTVVSAADHGGLAA